ncbi:hypothetical protein KUTeg_022058 [Tegillarca granosa]|uniref:SWIM-type domain-containing protein n=1 Tax=Tegillarca granosa TaxID=220873 RepID=A0ABQ9E844_TEGGR|nr:hypothetical protein KUTeg_022058 [Tegillarca granosa]
MTAKHYKVFVCLSSKGDVQGGSYDCVAGKGEACNHIAALLFALEDYIAKGLKDLPQDQTRTDGLCQWNKPAKRKFEPQTVHNIKVVK